jgi:hypothetical protein
MPLYAALLHCYQGSKGCLDVAWVSNFIAIWSYNTVASAVSSLQATGETSSAYVRRDLRGRMARALIATIA